MKKQLLTLTCTLSLFAATAALAQDHRPDPGDHHDQMQQHQDSNRFNDHDRQAAQDWYHHNQSHAPQGFRDRDRLKSGMADLIQADHVLDRRLRNMTHTLPAALLRTLSPAPRHYKYVVVGGHIVLLDSRTYMVRDVIHVRQ